MEQPIVTRRRLLVHLGAVVVSVFGWRRLVDAQAQTRTPITVYKDPECGCCGKWVEHMQASGFAPLVTVTPDLPGIRARNKVHPSVSSCHTSLIGGYVIEGHVPASDVRKLLAQKPRGIIGISIPGMPSSAPGMDMEPFRPFSVMTFDEKGALAV